MAAPVSFTNLPLSASSTLAEVVAALDSIGLSGVTFETWYNAAHAKDPSLTPYQGGSIWIVGQDLSGGLGAATTATGTATDQAAQGATTGADQFAKSLSVGSFLGDLTSRALWLRIAKVIVGLGLIIIGLVQLTHAQNIATAAAKGAVLA
jgi:hypothetical protein